MFNVKLCCKLIIFACLLIVSPLWAYEGDQILDNVQPEGGGTAKVATLTLMDTGTINGLDAVDATTTSTIRGLFSSGTGISITSGQITNTPLTRQYPLQVVQILPSVGRTLISQLRIILNIQGPI